MKNKRISAKERREEQKRLNKIPDIYLTNHEINMELQNKIKNGGIANGKGINKV